MSIKLNDKYFQLYSCCIPVKGAARSIICDLQRGDFIFIPNEFADILLRKGNIRIEKLIRQYEEYENFEEELKSLISIMCEKEYGFITNNPANFPELNENIEIASSITNVIIDIENELKFDLKKFINDVSSHLCHAVAIRIFSEKSIRELSELIKAFDNSTIRSLELSVPFTNEFADERLLLNLMEENPICKVIIIHTSNRTERFKNHYHELMYVNWEMKLNSCCGFVSPHYFRVNNQTFFESKVFNNCLNRKLSVDKDGMICNCPSMKTRYGKYEASTRLSDILALNEFQSPWHITKDHVETCRDCEFRYICHDCRAILKDNTNPLSKPGTCKYDPYTAKWE